MPDAKGLTTGVWQLAHELSEQVLELTAKSALRCRGFFADQMSDAAVSALASIAATGGAIPVSGISTIEYIGELRAARNSLTVLAKQLGRAVDRGYVAESDAAGIAEKVDELQGLVLMLTLAIRRNTGLNGVRRTA